MLAALLLTLLAAAPPGPAAAQPRKPGLAVMDVQGVQGVAAGTALQITDVVVTTVSAPRRFQVISRADIANLLGLEKQKQLLSCSEDSSCLAELGGALGVDYVLAGSVGQLGTRFRVSLTIQDVRRARVVARQALYAEKDEDALARATVEVVRNLLAEFDGKPVAVQGEGGLRELFTTQRGWGWITGGTGVAVLAAAAAFDVSAARAYEDQKVAVKTQDRAAYDEARDAAVSRGKTAKVLYGVGGVVLIGGAALWFTAPQAGTVAVVPMPGGALAVFGGTLP